MVDEGKAKGDNGVEEVDRVYPKHLALQRLSEPHDGND